jgi:hypothetical protein
MTHPLHKTRTLARDALVLLLTGFLGAGPSVALANPELNEVIAST